MNGAGKTAHTPHHRVFSGGMPVSPMRKCIGECNKRKSIMQFKGDSQKCNQCVRQGK